MQAITEGGRGLGVLVGIARDRIQALLAVALALGAASWLGTLAAG